jgi:hypothetical protein
MGDCGARGLGSSTDAKDTDVPRERGTSARRFAEKGGRTAALVDTVTALAWSAARAPELKGTSMSEHDEAADLTVVEAEGSTEGENGEIVSEDVVAILDAEGHVVAVDDVVTVVEPDGSMAFDETVSVVDDDGELVTVEEIVGAQDADGNAVIAEATPE